MKARITTSDLYEKLTVIFMIFFTAYYPCASQMIYASSHAAIRPCTCCTFERKKNDCGSAYAY